VSDEKRAAAIAMLEAELERRIEERLASGDLVRSEDSGVIVTGVPGCRELPKRWIEKVKNGPDILHDPWGVIVTGVPRAGDDDEGVVAPTSPVVDPPALTIERPDRLPPAPKPAEPKEPAYCAPDQASTRVFVVISNGDDNDPGQVEHGRFSVEGGVLTLTDAAGAYLGAKRLRENDAPTAVARQLLRDSIDAGGEFNRRLPYRPLGIA
jgi:hypothetical protein